MRNRKCLFAALTCSDEKRRRCTDLCRLTCPANPVARTNIQLLRQRKTWWSAQGTFPSYDVSSDGQRLLMLKPAEEKQAAPTQINVVLNWFEELKRRVPSGKK